MNPKCKSSTDKGASYDSKINEFINLDILSNEELKGLDGLDMLTSKAKETFEAWCEKIKVPQKIELYNPLSMGHESEIAYRKARDEEHKFSDITRSIFTKSKVEYRNNRVVILIITSGQQLESILNYSYFVKGYKRFKWTCFG